MPEKYLCIGLKAIPNGTYLVTTEWGPVLRVFKDGKCYFVDNLLHPTEECSPEPLLAIIQKVL